MRVHWEAIFPIINCCEPEVELNYEVMTISNALNRNQTFCIAGRFLGQLFKKGGFDV